jgi:hypothetical protein
MEFAADSLQIAQKTKIDASFDCGSVASPAPILNAETSIPDLQKPRQRGNLA